MEQRVADMVYEFWGKHYRDTLEYLIKSFVDIP